MLIFVALVVVFAWHFCKSVHQRSDKLTSTNMDNRDRQESLEDITERYAITPEDGGRPSNKSIFTIKLSI